MVSHIFNIQRASFRFFKSPFLIHPSIPYLSSPLLHHLLTSSLFLFFLFFSLSIRLTRKIRLRQIRISRQNKRFNLRQSIQRIIAESQMILDRLLGRQSQPLRNGNVVVDGRLENFCLCCLVRNTCVAGRRRRRRREKEKSYRDRPSLLFPCFRDSALLSRVRNRCRRLGS